MRGLKLNLYLDRVELQVKDATDEGLEALAFDIEGRSKVNVSHNDQIDTGFMLNSHYVVSKRRSTYLEARPDGVYSGRKTSGGERHKAPERRLPLKVAAAVVVGANYSIFQELRVPFLFPAAQQAAVQAKGTLEKVYRLRIGRV